MTLGSHWGPNGSPCWVPITIFWESFFELVFGTDPAAILGGAGVVGGACLNMQILQELGRKSNTPLDPCGARRIYSLAFAQGLAPDHLKQLEDKIRIECPLLGMPVVIVGTSREDLNGQVGLAQSFDEALGRYVVKLDAPLTVSPTLKLKPGNLVPVPRT